ncbi:hypothetical protein SKA34_16930 [Photobacterium sp. SKA34]|nr:hypothetical protein SKA34_16930 [Photobacterium sp. SKA34]
MPALFIFAGMRSMIKIKKDELIHGYLIRVLTIAGELQQTRDLAGILSDSGVIRELPILNEQQRTYFTPLTFKDIEHILTNNTPYRYTNTEVYNYVGDYVFKGKNEGNKNNLNSRTELRYCIECFREQIKIYGFAWFRLNWGYFIDCDIHDKRMCSLHTVIQKCCGKYANIFNCLQSALSGKCFNCQSSNWAFSSTVYLTDRNRSNYLTF